MKKCESVIFLIDSEYFNNNIISTMLEKLTQCRVFSFFSLEESLLYWNLKPTWIIHNDTNESIIPAALRQNLRIIDLSKYHPLNSLHKLRDFTIAQELASLVLSVDKTHQAI